jgi:hypothetical protein
MLVAGIGIGAIITATIGPDGGWIVCALPVIAGLVLLPEGLVPSRRRPALRAS